MGQKIKKSVMLDEIKAQIFKCSQYQKADPDKNAQKRVESMEKNPCNSKKFFVNLTLKNPEIAQTEKMSERLKRAKSKRFLANNDDIKKIYEDGCIIEVTVSKTAPLSFSVSSKSCYDSMMCDLISKYFDDSCMMMKLNPKMSMVGNYIKDDVTTALNSGKKKIVYAMARFSLKALKEMVKDEYDTERYDISSFSLNNMNNVPYVDMTRQTSMEQNVNAFFNNPGVMNSMTMFSCKSKLPNYDLKKDHAVYDMCTYVNLKMKEVKTGDDALAQKKYKFYSEGRDEIFRDKSEARFEVFKSFGGTWSDWNAAETQYLTFKAVSAVDGEFLKEAENNGSFMNNILAYEKTISLFSNSTFQSIKESWKKDGDKFKRQPPAGIQFDVKYNSGAAQGDATSFVMANMVDPPKIVVEPYGCTKIKFDDNVFYKFCVPGNTGMSEDDYAKSKDKDERYHLLGDSKSVYAKICGFYKSNNKITIKRDTIKLDYTEYLYTGEEMKLDEKNSTPYIDEATHEGMKFTVPAKSYYNPVERVYFNADKLDDRFKFCMFNYQIIPKVVSLPYVFIQDSSFETKAQAEEREKKVREDWKDKFVRCCVDSINYDPWRTVIDRLKKLYCRWAKLCSDENDMLEIPPMDLTDKSDEKCSKCGNPKNECTCKEIKLCTNCYPLDIYGIAGKINLEELATDDKDYSLYGLFTAAGYMYDQANHPLTYAEIAHYIYEAIYMKQSAEVIPVEMFSVTNQYSLMVLTTTFETIKNSYQYQIDGTVASRFTIDTWEKFVKEYSTGLKAGENMHSSKFADEFKVGIIDGYAYIPTGHKISFEYDSSSQTFNVKGATSSEMAILSQLIDCTEEEYMSRWKTTAAMCSPLSDDMKKFIVYPYMPSLDAIISGTLPNTKEPDEYDEDYFYVPEKSDVSSVMNSSGSGLTQVRFSIYIKRAIICSYPKNKVPMCRTCNSDGFCGLREMFEKPLTVCPYEFDIEKEIMNRIVRKKRIEMKKVAIELKDNTGDLKYSACNVSKNLHRVDDVKEAAISKIIDFANEKKDLMILVGRDKSDDGSQESMLCEALSNQSQRSVMLDYDMVFNQTVNAIELIGDDNLTKSKESIIDMTKDFITISNSLKESIIETLAAFPVFMLCNKKYNDYLTDQCLPKPLDEDLIDIVKEEYAKEMMQKTSTRISNTEIVENVDKFGDLKPRLKMDLIDSIKMTNIEEIKALIKQSEELQGVAEGETLDEKAMSIIKKACETGKQKASLMSNVKKEISSALAPTTCTKSYKEKFASPKDLADGLTLVKDIIKCSKKFNVSTSKALSDGIKKTVEENIYPLFECPLPNEDKNDESSTASMNDKIEDSNKKLEEDISLSKALKSLSEDIDKARKEAAKSTSEYVINLIISSCGPYIDSTVTGAAALGGVAGALSAKSEDLKTPTISAINQMITGALNSAIKKTNIEETIKTALDEAADSAKEKFVVDPGKIAKTVERIKGDMADAVGEKLVDDLKSIVEGSLGDLKSMKKRIDEKPALNEIVTTIMKKTKQKVTEAIMGFCNGSSSFTVENQDNDATKNVVENESASADALVQVFKYIKDNVSIYQQLTGEFITFDS